MGSEPDDRGLYEEHADELVRFATGLVGPDDAPDVVADAFLAVSRSPIWSRAKDRRALWYRAVSYRAQSLTRSNTRRLRREALVAASTDRFVAAPSTPDTTIGAALSRISVQQRAIVILTYWSDMRPSEVAEVLGISEGSVKKQLARARHRLRKELR